MKRWRLLIGVANAVVIMAMVCVLLIALLRWCAAEGFTKETDMRMSNRPTRGTPLSAEEREAGQRMRTNLKGWQGGARYNYTSNFGSSSSNTGTRTSRKAGNIAGKTTAVVKPVWRPRWARKYEQENS